MAKKIYFASLKGGTGVTTVCVGLGLALSDAGERTLIVDGDTVSACAMTVAGLGNMQVYTLADYERAACRAKQAMTAHPKSGNLSIMPALGLKDLSFIRKAVSEVEGLFDYILLDRAAPSCCDEAVIVTEPYLPSVKSADSCKAMLDDGGIKQISLIVNKLCGAQVFTGEVLSAEQAADILRLNLLAVIPEDPTISVGKWRTHTVEAFRCAAEAITGQNGDIYDVLKGYSGVSGLLKRKMRARI